MYKGMFVKQKMAWRSVPTIGKATGERLKYVLAVGASNEDAVSERLNVPTQESVGAPAKSNIVSQRPMMWILFAIVVTTLVSGPTSVLVYHLTTSTQDSTDSTVADSPPPPLPPATPGGSYVYAVKFTATLDGAISSYDDAAYKAGIASALNVDVADVDTTASAGSVVVQTTVKTYSLAATTAALATIASWTTDVLSTQVSSTVIAIGQATQEQVVNVVLSPSPHPPPPPPPNPSPPPPPPYSPKTVLAADSGCFSLTDPVSCCNSIDGRSTFEGQHCWPVKNWLESSAVYVKSDGTNSGRCEPSGFVEYENMQDQADDCHDVYARSNANTPSPPSSPPALSPPPYSPKALLSSDTGCYAMQDPVACCNSIDNRTTFQGQHCMPVKNWLSASAVYVKSDGTNAGRCEPSGFVSFESMQDQADDCHNVYAAANPPHPPSPPPSPDVPPQPSPPPQPPSPPPYSPKAVEIGVGCFTKSGPVACCNSIDGRNGTGYYLQPCAPVKNWLQTNAVYQTDGVDTFSRCEPRAYAISQGWETQIDDCHDVYARVNPPSPPSQPSSPSPPSPPLPPPVPPAPPPYSPKTALAAGVGCFTLTTEVDCCNGIDGRDAPYGGQHCVPSIASTFPSAGKCEPKSWVESNGHTALAKDCHVVYQEALVSPPLPPSPPPTPPPLPPSLPPYPPKTVLASGDGCFTIASSAVDCCNAIDGRSGDFEGQHCVPVKNFASSVFVKSDGSNSAKCEPSGFVAFENMQSQADDCRAVYAA